MYSNRPRNTPDILHGATWALAGALSAIVLVSSLIDGPSDTQAAQDVADEAAYAATVADGGASKCAALGRTAVWTPNGDLICRLPARQPSAVTTVAQGGQP